MAAASGFEPVAASGAQLIALRRMLATDLPEVQAIEQAVAGFPWPSAHFDDSLAAGHDCTVMTQDGQLCAYSIFSQVVDEASLLNIAVSSALQGQGFGRLLLADGLKKQRRAGASQCFLEVRASNVTAQALYRSAGFKPVGERKDYYPAHTGREHAIVMCADLPTSVEMLNNLYSTT